MTHSLQSSAGVAAGVISLLAYFPYARDIVRGVARPDRATWLIWSVVGGLLFASYAAAAGGAALWVPLSDALGPALIVVLTIRSGEGGLSRFDYGWDSGGNQVRIDGCFNNRLSLSLSAIYPPLPSTPCGDRSGLHHLRDYYALD